MRTFHVANVCDWRAAELWRTRHAPARQNKLTFAIPSDSDDGSELFGEDCGEERQIAGAVVLHGEEIANC